MNTHELQYKAIQAPTTGTWLVIEFYHLPGYGESHTDYWNIAADSAESAVKKVTQCLLRGAFESVAIDLEDDVNSVCHPCHY